MSSDPVAQDVRRPWLWCMAVVAVGLCAGWPFAWHGYPWNTDDVQWHSIWARQFLVEMQRGAVYPRWLHGMNAGAGSPTFFFYGPVSYWATSLASFVVGDADAFRALSIVAGAALCASGVTAFVWLRSLVGPVAAAMGAALYVVLPYHLTVDVWTRSAFAEANGYVWTPLLFLGVEQVRGGRRAGVLVLSLGFGLLASTHIITAMLAGLAAGLYALLRFRSIGSLLVMAAAMALGAGLAGGYLATALGLKDLTEHTVGVLSPGLFVPMAPGELGRPQLVRVFMVLWVAELAGVVAFAALGVIWVRGGVRGLWLAWAGLLGVLLLAMTRPMEPLWNAVPVLQNVQFPSRLFALVDLGLATAAAVAVASLPARAWRYGVAGLVVLAGVGAAQAVLPLRAGAFDRGAANWGAEWAIQGDHGFFRPLESVGRLPQDRRPPGGSTEPLVFLDGGSALVTGSWPRRYEVEVEAPGPAILRLRQLHFAGWQASVDGAVLPVRAGPTGLVEVAVPGGRHRVSIVLAATGAERAGWAVGVGSALVWLGLLGWAFVGGSGRSGRVARAGLVG